MRRILVLTVAFGLLVLLKQTATATISGAPDPMTLAAVGFVVLTAFTIGELGGQARLPRITGYILSGIILGPHVSDLLSHSVVHDMGVFNTLALGLIALTAGLELSISDIRGFYKALLGTLSAKLPLLLFAVGGTFMFMETAWAFLGLQTFEERAATAVILSILGIGTSPAIVLAVANETGANGRLTKLSLAMSVVKDLVVVVSLAIGIAFAQAILSDESGFRLQDLGAVGLELLGSLIVGAIIGGLLVGYIRYVHQEMLLAILTVVLLGADLVHALHLELLLVFIAAGFVVRNLSEHAEQLHHPLTRVALPVFVVFFTTAGAVVDLQASFALLPLAGSLVIARIGAFYVASRWGAWIAGEEPVIQNYAWLTYWPQAGITLGLVRLAAYKVPALAAPLEETGFALVAINLLLGPIAVGIAFRRGDEKKLVSTSEEAHPSQDLTPRVSPILPRSSALLPILPFPSPIEDPKPGLKSRLESEPLIGLVTSLSLDLEGEADDFVKRHLAPIVEKAQQTAERMLNNAVESRAVVVAVRKTISEEPISIHEDWEPSVTRLRKTLINRLLRLPFRLQAPLSPGLLVPRAKDSWNVRLARWQLRTTRRLSQTSARTRNIHLQVIARHNLEPRIASGLRAMNRTHFEHYARMLDEVRAVVAAQCSPAEAREGVEQIARRWIIACRKALQDELRLGIVMTAELAAEAGVPGNTASRLRLSEIQNLVIADVEGFKRDSKRWRKIASASLDTLRAEAMVEEANEVLGNALKRRVLEPLDIVRHRLLPISRQTAKRLQVVLSDVEAADAESLDLTSALSKTSAAFPKGERRRVDRARASFGRLTRQTRPPEDLARIQSAAPERLDLLPPEALREAREQPERVSVVPVPFARRIEEVISSLVVQIRDTTTPLEALVLAFDRQLRDATHITAYGVEAAHSWERNAEDRKSTAIRSLTRGQKTLERLVSELSQSAQAAEEAAYTTLKETRELLRAVLYDQRSRTVSRVRSSFLAQIQTLFETLANATQAIKSSRRFFLRSMRQSFELRHPSGHAPQDAGSLRRQLAANSPSSHTLDLPAIYLKVFDLTPVTDLRIAVAREAEAGHASRLFSSERGAGQDVPKRLIIEGSPGSGRTSFLNVLERNAKGWRTLRIDPVFHPRQQGLVGALAVELGCDDHPLVITQALLSEPTLVLIDDLSLHVMPHTEGIEELEELFRIVVDTARQTAWAVSVNSHNLHMFAKLVPISVYSTSASSCNP